MQLCPVCHYIKSTFAVWWYICAWPSAYLRVLGIRRVPHFFRHANRTKTNCMWLKVRQTQNSDDWADHMLAVSNCACHLPCAASSPHHKQTPCATAFSVSLWCVCRFLFTEFARLCYICARESNLPRLDNFSRNQNWHAAIYTYVLYNIICVRFVYTINKYNWYMYTYTYTYVYNIYIYIHIYTEPTIKYYH